MFTDFCIVCFLAMHILQHRSLAFERHTVRTILHCVRSWFAWLPSRYNFYKIAYSAGEELGMLEQRQIKYKAHYE
jgi:hypothetical protein